MKCLSNLNRISYNNETVNKITKLYQYKGKDFYFEDVLKNYIDGIIRITIERDAIFAGKLLGLKISENRMRLIVKKDSTPKTNDEVILQNLKEVFKIVQNVGSDFRLDSNEFLKLGYRIFKDVEDISYNKTTRTQMVNMFEEKVNQSKRDEVGQIIKLYKTAIETTGIEVTQASTDLYIDMINSNVFNAHNDFIALLILYCLLFKSRFNVFKYESFFELYYNNNDKFKNLAIAASYNWESGFAQTSVFTNALFDLLLEGYELVQRRVDNFLYDKRIKKIDNVEGVILKLGQSFRRDQIKQRCPELSDSTINRALEKLKKEGKIESTGTGRSATWIKLEPDEMFSEANRQLSIFDLMEQQEGR